MEKLIKARHLKKYVKEGDHKEESGQAANRIKVGAAIPLEYRPAINYILGSPSNDQYQSKCRQKKLLRAATVKAKINSIHIEGSHEEIKPIDGPMSFPSVNPNRIIVPHYDSLVLSLYINGLDVHRVLVDLDSAVNLLQLAPFKKMKLSISMLISAKQILSDLMGQLL